MVAQQVLLRNEPSTTAIHGPQPALKRPAQAGITPKTGVTHGERCRS